MNSIDTARQRLRGLSDIQLWDEIDNIAKTIVVRTYNEYGSVDTARESTKEEYDIIRKIVHSAVFTFKSDDRFNSQTIVNMAENTLIDFMDDLPQFENWHVEKCNCYLTIYNPLLKLFGMWGC